MTRRTFDSSSLRTSRALAELRSELEAIPHDEIEPIRLDIVSAYFAVRPVINAVKSFRGQIAVELSEGAALHVDLLESSVMACLSAHVKHSTKRHGNDVADLIAELGKTRRVLLLEADGLVAKKLLSRTALADLVGGNGYKELCFDVLQLVEALRADWATIASETPVSERELDEAEVLANEVAIVLGENAGTPASPETAELRSRAYTYFVRTYDEVRRAMTFIRWEQNDVDDFVPSLFAGRSRKKGEDEDVDVIDPVVAPVVTPVVNDSNGAPTIAAPVVPVAPVAPGMPGGSPFQS